MFIITNKLTISQNDIIYLFNNNKKHFYACKYNIYIILYN